MSEIREAGVNLAKDKKYNEAIYLLEHAANNGDIDAVNDIGVIYELEGDYDKAMELYQYAALFGSRVAIHNAGNLYENGKGVKANDVLAMHLYKRSAKMNYSHAFYKIASFYQFGKVVEKDEKEAFKWAKKGARLELKTKDQSACLITLGYYYELGIGVKKSNKKASKYYSLAAERENIVGKFNSALIYLYRKRKTKKNTKYGIDLLMECSKKNYPDSFAELAILYQKGKLVKKDPELADYWIRKGIENGSWRAYLVYSDMCLSGENLEEKKYIEGAVRALAIFLTESGEYLEDYLNQYNDLKKNYPDEIDWDYLEKNPDLFR